MLCSKEDLKVYKNYIDSVNNGLVYPYDDELLYNLSTHKNKNMSEMKSYLDTLCSYNDIGNDIVYCRYLMLFLDTKEYKLYDGYLSNFERKFNHCWIENKDFVYDTTFIGKWPKEVYYEVFKPVIKTIVNTSTDKEYNVFKKNNTEVNNTNNDFVYFDWYRYMKNNTLNTRAISEPLMRKKFK